uniref:C2 domain-containing protein n=1 Tax=Trieres chinensis TaxID=1514140 RepID=A0A7S2A4M6_TRICV|mmetsp:Transcript_39856/g.81366  ORF Transcript_39856/g.81366 Transcript_39856/m.81366 type:complete len:564 (+) Transcript_39856:67-1758(+)
MATKPDPQDSAERTDVDPTLFVLPAQRLGVSGGTAPFFALQLRDPPPGKSADRYIGKDLSHATDEFDFYEKILRLRQAAEDDRESWVGPNRALLPLLEYAFEYAGVLTAQEATDESDGGANEEKTIDLLVMGNLRSGKQKLRMLDLKMGHLTAQGGWQGKTHIRAARQNVMDAATNSTTEGFRLEGFDGMPDAIKSRLETADVLKLMGEKPSPEMMKKVARKAMQVMKGDSILSHFTDVHLDGYDNIDISEIGTERYTPTELAEIVLHQTTKQLLGLAVACHGAPFPQKWIGSSIALGYDAGTLPRRSPSSEEALRASVLCHVFDWGRSELNTHETYDAMTEVEKEDRKKFWGYYCSGVDRLALCSARAYWNRFGNTGGWSTVTFQVKDYDSISADDFMGEATVAVSPTKTGQCLLKGGLLGKASMGTLSYSIEWHDAPDESRLKGWWRVHVGQGTGLPIKDHLTKSSDPYCLVYARSSGGKFKFHQTTKTIEKNLNPTWDESFDLPVARSESPLKQEFSVLGIDDFTDPKVLKQVLNDDVDKSSFSSWSSRLEKSARSLSED